MVNLFGALSRIKKNKVMVVGDFNLDTYTVGKARRISPEAPVVVLNVQREEHRPGSAGNVVLNLVALGADVVAMGRRGPDKTGEVLFKSLASDAIDLSGFVIDPGFGTPVKNRIIANNQQIVRVDYEEVCLLPEMLEQQVIESLPLLLRGVKVIAISDYGKGFLTPSLLSAVIDAAKQHQIPVIADPKGTDFSKYSGASVIKPNSSELFAAANLPVHAPIEQAAERVLEAICVDALMVTRSEEGISLFYPDKRRQDYPVRVREVKDVTGAGDTVLAVLAYAMASGLSVEEGAQLSNVAAGIAVEKFGCAQVSMAELARRLLGDATDNKIFDEEHLFALQEALKGRKFALLALSSAEGLKQAVFSAIRQLARRDNWDLVVYVQDLEPDKEFLDVVASLHDVDYLVVNSGNLRHLATLISPKEIHVMEDAVLKRVGATVI